MNTIDRLIELDSAFCNSLGFILPSHLDNRAESDDCVEGAIGITGADASPFSEHHHHWLTDANHSTNQLMEKKILASYR